MNPRIIHLIAVGTLCLTLPACFWRKGKEDDFAEKADNSAAPRPTVMQADPTPVATMTGYGWDGTQSVGNYKARLEHVVQAAQSVMRKLDFQPDMDASQQTATTAKLVGSNIDKRMVEIKIKSVPAKGDEPASVEAKIKIGVTGDRSGAERMLDEIQKALGNRAK